MDDPLVENPKIFPEFFFYLGVGGKKTPPPWGIEDILDSKPWPPKSHNHREGWE